MPVSRYERLDEKLDKVLASLSESREDLARLGEHTRGVDGSITSLAEHVAKQNGRIRKLENWKAGVVAVGAFVGVIAKVLFDLFTK